MYLINCGVHIDEERCIENGYIAINDGKIAAMGDMSEYTSSSDETIDLKGRQVYPGFIDAHCHLGMWENGLGFEGDDGNEQTDPATPQLRALDAVNGYDSCFDEALGAGITTVLTGPGSSNPIAGQSVCIKTCPGMIDDRILLAPAAMKLSLGENPKTSYHDRDETPMTRMATAAIIREQLFKAKRYDESIALAEENGDELPEYDMKLEALRPVIRGELPVHVHAHRRDDIFTAVRIAKEFSLKLVVVHATEGHLCAEDLAGTGVPVMSGPFMCDRPKPELRNQTPASPGIMAKAGIPVSIVTDHPVTPIQYLPVCAALAVREGMDKKAALAAITSVPARQLGIFDRVGSLEVGKDADMGIYSTDPISLDGKPEMMIVNGKVCFNRMYNVQCTMYSD